MIYRSMSRMLIVAGLVLMVVVVFSGCAAIDAAYDRARWRWDGFETGRYVWTKAERETVTSICRMSASRAYGGCALRTINPARPNDGKPIPGRRVTTGVCYIIADVDEEDAKRLASRDGDSLYDHELRHCLGWVHPDRRYR